jgi:diguanylate cyclase
VTGKASRDVADKQLYRAIGEFLAAQGLAPDPANYALIHCLMTDETSPAAKAVLALTADGVRMTQGDADRIREEHEIDGHGAALAHAGEALSEARRYVADVGAVIEAAREEAQAYGTDLARGAAELDKLDPAHPTIASVIRVTSAMMERTRAAEAQLEAARQEARTLRARLAAVQEQALSDPLTRLPNRRAFEDRLADVCAAGEPCSLAICDIDHFKAVNDSHGHSVGDRVLRMVAEVLRSTCGEHMVARFGGEEFVILFEQMTPADAGKLVEQARADLASRQFKVRGTDAPLGQVTFSAGVARCTGCEGEPPLKRADTLLYQAKKDGRNRVAVEAD